MRFKNTSKLQKFQIFNFKSPKTFIGPPRRSVDHLETALLAENLLNVSSSVVLSVNIVQLGSQLVSWPGAQTAYKDRL